MKNLGKDIQQEAQRGQIVRILVEWRLEWMPFTELRLQLLRRCGYGVSDEELQFHLNYLSRGGYVDTKQLRAARAGIEMTAVCATASAISCFWRRDVRPAEDAEGTAYRQASAKSSSSNGKRCDCTRNRPFRW